MKLSACLIVKDEEDVIQRCLESIDREEYVDEICIIDTGSTDNTVNIIKNRIEKWGDYRPFRYKFEQIPWNGSFASMRNKSMDLASGDCILIIDADEYIEDPAHWQTLREAINTENFLCALLPIMNTGRGIVMGEKNWQPRVLLNHPDIRYKFAVHNQIDDQYLAYAKSRHEETGDVMEVMQVPLQITHTGYDITPEEAIEKYKKRAEVCRGEIVKAIADNNQWNKAYYEFQLAAYLTMIAGPEHAIPVWEEIDYNYLFSYNKWYAHYVATQCYKNMVVLSPDMPKDEKLTYLYKSLRHCGGMFGAMNNTDKHFYQQLAPEPASWMMTGAIMLEISHLEENEADRNKAIILLIDALLRSFTPPRNMRCVVNQALLFQDIKAQFNKGTMERDMLEVSEPARVTENLRMIQRSLQGFDESLLELVDKTYV